MPDRSNPAEAEAVVLLVEDDGALSKLRALALEERGLKVVTSGSLDEARAALATTPQIDAVLTDIKLSDEPGDMGGIELAHEVRSRFGDIPLFAYSAFYADEALAEGDPVFDRYLTKGNRRVSELEELLDEISAMARESRSRRNP